MPTSTSSTESAAPLEVARVLRPHGLRGELKVELYWAGSDSLLEARSIFVAGEARAKRVLEVEAVRRSGRFALVKLRGVDDRDAAEALRGARLCVEREALPGLAEGEYYLVDLVGAAVLGPEGPIGEVVDVRVYPSADALVVRTPDGGLAEQPLSPPFVERVDARAKVVILANTDGLIA